MERPAAAPFQRPVVEEVVVHDRGALRGGQHLRPQPDERPRRDAELDLRNSAMVFHPLELALTLQLPAASRRSWCSFGTSTTRCSYGSMLVAVDFLNNHSRLADRDFRPLTPHRFEQHAEVKQPATADDELAFAFTRRDARATLC